MKRTAKKIQFCFFATNAPESHLGSPMTKVCLFEGGQKFQKLKKRKNLFFYGSNTTKSHFGVSNDQNLHFYGGQGKKNS